MPPDISVSYAWAVAKCNAPNVLYHQSYRDSDYYGGYNGIYYYDCSSFIWFALKAGGFEVIKANGGQSWPFTTSYMGPVLQRLGFVSVPLTAETKPGDVCVYVGSGDNVGHTEMVYQGGVGSSYCMGAVGRNGGLTPAADQVRIRTTPTRNTRWQYIWRYGQGAIGVFVPIYVVAAIAGCWWIESGVNPGIWESLTVMPWDYLYQGTGVGGYGLGQWTNTSTSFMRLNEMHNWLTANGYSDDDGDGQLNYMFNIEKIWYSANSVMGYSSLEEFIHSDSTDLARLTEEFLACWEGNPGNALQQRIARANDALDYITAHMNDPASDYQWISGNRYLTEEERYNNIMCLYFRLSDNDPFYWKTKHKMPVWMMLRYL